MNKMEIIHKGKWINTTRNVTVTQLRWNVWNNLNA